VVAVEGRSVRDYECPLDIVRGRCVLDATESAGEFVLMNMEYAKDVLTII
jgi:hypothetical protein